MMPSQTDLDQGGTFREWVNTYLGPSVGWVRAPAKNNLGIAAAGTYTIDLSTNYVLVNVAGAVTIILPSVIVPANPPPGAIPGVSVRANVTVIDSGGFASGNPITIKPASVAETIMGLTQIQITTNYGGFILQPIGGQRTWVNAQ
jgi:hypothetical protein